MTDFQDLDFHGTQGPERGGSFLNLNASPTEKNISQSEATELALPAAALLGEIPPTPKATAPLETHQDSMG